jgi:predicted nucleic acid-binding protein
VTVIDASVWVSALSQREPHHAASRRWLEAQPDLTTPVLALAETAGAVARRTGSADDGRLALRTVLATPGLRLVPIDRGIGEEAAELAAAHRLRGADAVYVAVARLLALPLATLDRELEARASAVVAVITP